MKDPSAEFSRLEQPLDHSTIDRRLLTDAATAPAAAVPPAGMDGNFIMEVYTAFGLQSALASNASHIEIQNHLDLTTLQPHATAGLDDVIKLFLLYKPNKRLKSIRVCISSREPLFRK